MSEAWPPAAAANAWLVLNGCVGLLKLPQLNWNLPGFTRTALAQSFTRALEIDVVLHVKSCPRTPTLNVIRKIKDTAPKIDAAIRREMRVREMQGFKFGSEVKSQGQLAARIARRCFTRWKFASVL